MVFIIQNSQNRDSKAMLLKLDELIRTSAGARNQPMNLESVSEEEFERLEGEFQRLRARFGHGQRRLGAVRAMSVASTARPQRERSKSIAAAQQEITRTAS